MKKLLKLLGLVGILFSAESALSAEWKANLFNPSPSEDDIILPLPCDGSIALRRVVTQQVANIGDPSTLLADKKVELGRATTAGERAYMESRRPDYISGPIASTDGQLSFLIGKYEVSQAQYDAVMARDPSECPSGKSPASALPVSDISWYDAVEFTRRINSWIYGDAIGVATMLISLDILDGYVRLPSETEWEFAARGGLAVSDSERANTTYPMPDGFNGHVWYNAPNSANGKLRPIGTRKPNPLGLYDIYGNVAEMMLEPFRMTKGDRLQGRIGGFIAKGGSFLDDASSITSALRNEYPYFAQSTSGEMHLRSVGFRIVVGTAAIGAKTDIEKLEVAAQEVGRQDPEAPDNAADASLQLALLAAQTEDASLRAEIDRLSGDLSAEFARRNELELQAVDGAIVNAALAGFELALTGRSLDKFQQLLQIMNSDEPDWAVANKRFDEAYGIFDMFQKRYTDAIQNLAADYRARVAERVPAVLRELHEQGSGALEPFVQLVGQQVDLYAQGVISETRDIVRQLVPGEHAWL